MNLTGRDPLNIFLWCWTGLVLSFLFLPILLVFVNALGTERWIKFPPAGLTLKWFLEIPSELVQAFITSLQVAFIASLFGSLLAVPASIAISRGNFRVSTTLDAIIRSPLQVPWLVTGVAFLSYYSFLRSKLNIPLLNTYLGLVLAHILVVTPYIYAASIARLSQLDPALEEAAFGLGASPRTTFLRVTFPLIRPAVFSGFLLSFLVSFDNLPVSIFLSTSKVVTFPVQLYFSLEFDLSRVQYAAASLVALFNTIIALVLFRKAGLVSIRPVN